MVPHGIAYSLFTEIAAVAFRLLAHLAIKQIKQNQNMFLITLIQPTRP
jgi:multidrug transporter EmrE-like cation transporter